MAKLTFGFSCISFLSIFRASETFTFGRILSYNLDIKKINNEGKNIIVTYATKSITTITRIEEIEYLKQPDYVIQLQCHPWEFNKICDIKKKLIDTGLLISELK